MIYKQMYIIYKMQQKHNPVTGLDKLLTGLI